MEKELKNKKDKEIENKKDKINKITQRLDHSVPDTAKNENLKIEKE